MLQPYKRLFEVNFPIEKGDTLLIGKWKNKPVEVIGFDTDDKNQPIIKTDKKDVKLGFRIKKLMPENKQLIVNCPGCGNDHDINQYRRKTGPIWCANCGYRSEQKELHNPFYTWK